KPTGVDAGLSSQPTLKTMSRRSYFSWLLLGMLLLTSGWATARPYFSHEQLLRGPTRPSREFGSIGQTMPGAGIWVAVSGSSRDTILRSDDGLNWKKVIIEGDPYPIEDGMEPGLKHVAFGDGIWIAILDVGQAAARSDDGGETWHWVSLPETEYAAE